MSANNLIRVQADDRSRYEHQAFDITFGGKPKESGATGYGTRMAATYEANFQMSLKLDDLEVGDQILMTLPPFIWANGYVVVEGGSGSPTGKLSIVTDLDDIAGSAVTLAAAVDLSTTMSAPVAFDAGVTIDVEPGDQYLVFEVTAVGTGIATMLIPAKIVQTGWK